MKIKKAQGIIIGSLIAAGLVGCSGSSTYNRDYDSPWRAKHDAEKSAASTEEFVEISLDDSVEVNTMEESLAAEDEMPETAMMDSQIDVAPELESVSDFEAEPVPVEEMSAFERLEMEAAMAAAEPETELAEVVEEETVETVEVVDEPVAAGSDIMSAPPKSFAVQAFAGRVLGNVTRYQNDHGLHNMQIVKTDLDGEIIHVLVSIHNDYESAVQAMVDLEDKTGSTPWVRSVASLQNIAAQ